MQKHDVNEFEMDTTLRQQLEQTEETPLKETEVDIKIIDKIADEEIVEENKEEVEDEEVIEETKDEIADGEVTEETKDEVADEEIKEEVAMEETVEIEEDVLSPEERDRIKKALEDMCKMKSEEFLLLGIQTTPEQIWSCVSHQYKKEYPELHQIVNDILSLKTSKFMNWLIIQNQRGLL